jgi:5-methylcytosine-specific restriction endonuclease McrA
MRNARTPIDLYEDPRKLGNPPRMPKKVYDHRLPLSPKLRKKIMERDGYACQYCGDTATEIEHVMPYTKGGPNDESNLVASCYACNHLALAKLFNSFDEKKIWILKTRMKVLRAVEFDF